MSKKFWIGCDIAKDTFWIAVAEVGDPNMEWTKLPNHEFSHNPKGASELVTWMKAIGINNQDVVGICLESTGRHSFRWVGLLGERLGTASIVNPVGPKALGESLGIREKSDRIDACKCAMFGRMKNPKPTVFRSSTGQALCEQYRLYQTLDSQRIAHKQRLDDGPSCTYVRACLRQQIKSTERQMEKIEAAMDKTIKADPVLSADAKQAQTVTGIGNKATWVILGEFGDLRQYKRNELVALAGLFPKQYTSGTSVYRKPRLAKGGGGRVRRVLYMCAMNAKKFNPHIKAFAQRLARNGKNPMQILGAIMRKLLLLVRAVIVSGKAYDPHYAHEVQCEAA